MSANSSESRFSLFRRRLCPVPTWRGWLALAGLALLTVLAFLRLSHPFLSVTNRVGGELLVVEGWCPDFAFKAAIQEFNSGGRRALLVTGGPLEKGEPLSEFRTYAELGAATLARLGLATDVVTPVPAPKVRQDRTYTSAVALRRWLAARGPLPAKLDVVSAGAHARRTRLLFQKAFGDATEIGIIAVADERYEPDRWWRSSMGFRTTTGELIGYAYARLLFREPEEE